jgi:hypothetical protein
LIYVICGILLISFAFAIGYGLWRMTEIPIRRWRESAFDYVYVDDDGNARELNAEEEDYVTTALFPDDEERFQIKPRYESQTPDGRLRGYLKRRRLPRKLAVAPAAKAPQSTGSEHQ